SSSRAHCLLTAVRFRGEETRARSYLTTSFVTFATFVVYICSVVIETSAPTRIDLAGGTIDIWPLYLFHPGAQTLNAAISLRARARIESRPDGGIVIRSEDTGVTVEASDWRELRDRRELPLPSPLVPLVRT